MLTKKMFRMSFEIIFSVFCDDWRKASSFPSSFLSKQERRNFDDWTLFYSPRLVYLQRNLGPASRSLACSHELNKSRERFLTITLLLILLASGAHKRRKLFFFLPSQVPSYVFSCWPPFSPF